MHNGYAHSSSRQEGAGANATQINGRSVLLWYHGKKSGLGIPLLERLGNSRRNVLLVDCCPRLP